MLAGEGLADLLADGRLLLGHELDEARRKVPDLVGGNLVQDEETEKMLTGAIESFKAEFQKE